MIRSDMEFFRDYDEWFTTSHLPKLNQEAVLPDHFYKPLTDFTLSIYTKPDMFILPPDTLMLEYWLFRYMAYKYRDTYRHPVAGWFVFSFLCSKNKIRFTMYESC